QLETAIENEEPYLCYLPVFDSEMMNGEADSYLSELNRMAKYLTENPQAYSLFKIFRDPTYAFEAPPVMYSYKDFRCYLYHKATGELIPTEDINKPTYVKHFLFRVFDLVYCLDRVSENGSSGPDEDKKCIYLAETSFDLFQMRQSVERELSRHGYTLFPHLPYPLEQSDLVDRSRQELKKCTLSVHLFGEHYTEPREGKEINISEFQNDIAARHFIEQSELSTREGDPGFSRIIWIPEKFEAKDHRQQKFIDALLKDESMHAGADIIRCPVEELKDLIIERLRNKHTTTHEDFELADNQKKVYVIHNDTAGEDVREFSSMLQSNNFRVLSAEEGVRYSEVRNTHKKNLLDCEGVVFFCHHNDEQWLRSKINDALKARAWGREDDYRFKAIVSYEELELPDGLKNQEYLMVSGEPQDTWNQLIEEIQN
ncbi:MAG: hypothetical protein WBH03_14260, partial [Cyclobacteriaceae bacterium]